MTTYEKKPLIYLAGPYSSPYTALMKERESIHAIVAVELKKQGNAVYCPIAETVTLAQLGGLSGTSWEDWRQHDLNLLSRCDQIYVLLIDGWKESLGVRGEVKFALKNHMPVYFINQEVDTVFGTDTLRMFGVTNIEELND